MKVTRTLQADAPPELAPICRTIGYLRADIWRRYGALGNVGRSALDIRKDIIARNLYGSLPVDGTIRNETTKDVVNDILTYKAAAKRKVRQAIAQRTSDPDERKRLYALLKNDQWQKDPFLHRQMRQHFRHGVSHTANQFIVRSDKHSSAVVDGRLVITIRMAKHYGGALRLVTTSNGKPVDLSGCNLRIGVKDGFTEIHYAADKGVGRPHGEQVLVNGAYTSQMDSTTGLLQGKRVGDKFYRTTGDVLQADHNAALNVLARLADPEITRFMPYRDVKRVLLARSPAPLSVKRLELGGSPRQPSADKSIEQV